MKRQVGSIVIVLAVLLVTLACQFGGKGGAEENGAPRTYFESLDLDSPEDAVQTFAQAFQRKDFMTVYLVLDTDAQVQQHADYLQTFSWQHLIGKTASEGWVNDASKNMDELFDTTKDAWYLFDQVMLYAATEDDLLIDLRGNLRILRSEGSKTRDGGQAVDVTAEVDGVSGEVVFRMVTDKGNRWRVYLVSAPGEGVDSWPSPLLNTRP